MTWFFAALVFTLGAIVGSFLNVVIHRYPREESIVFPPSRCPHCSAGIRPWDNVPILAYLWLGGRCRSCRGSISMRYPVIELTNALFYLAIYLRTGPSWAFLPIAVMVSMTLVLIYIDMDVQLLPDVITIPGTVVGIIAGAMGIGHLSGDLRLVRSWSESVIGAVVGAAVVGAVMGLYWLVRRVQGIGWGDVKMLAMVGAFAGGPAAVVVLLLGSLLGTVVGLPLAMRQREGMLYALPFGVFLGLALLIVVFFGKSLVWMSPLLLQSW